LHDVGEFVDNDLEIPFTALETVEFRFEEADAICGIGFWWRLRKRFRGIKGDFGRSRFARWRGDSGDCSNAHGRNRSFPA